MSFRKGIRKLSETRPISGSEEKQNNKALFIRHSRDFAPSERRGSLYSTQDNPNGLNYSSTMFRKGIRKLSDCRFGGKKTHTVDTADILGWVGNNHDHQYSSGSRCQIVKPRRLIGTIQNRPKLRLWELRKDRVVRSCPIESELGIRSMDRASEQYKWAMIITPVDLIMMCCQFI